ncbi:MAG TPA: hypothetical protein VL522_01070 [Bordetella sp.]|nr:hypothetical protein [Bordetella sp.]
MTGSAAVSTPTPGYPPSNDDAALRQAFATEVGHNYTFTSPLGDAYFEVPPPNPLPRGAMPILDDETGLCIGYSVEQVTGVWHIYDANGNFATMQEAPLEAPLIDPTDLLFMGLGFVRLFRGGTRAIAAVVERRGVMELATHVSVSLRALLRSRLRGLSPRALKFATVPARHMQEPGRYVPVYILERAIRYGRRMADPRLGAGAFRYEIEMTRLVLNKATRAFERRAYTLEVVVRESDWTIFHFLYK